MKICYTTLDKKCVIYVSMKCCYTTMTIHMKENQLLKGNMGDTNCSKIGIVRSPYSRIESFYKQVLIENMNRPNAVQLWEANKLSAAAKKLTPFFGKQNLLNKQVTFEQFIVEALGEGYKESHVNTQNQFIPPEVTEIYKLEDKIKMKQLEERLGFALHRANATKSYPLQWTTQMYSIVNNYYQDDFIRFNYQQRNI